MWVALVSTRARGDLSGSPVTIKNALRVNDPSSPRLLKCCPRRSSVLWHAFMSRRRMPFPRFQVFRAIGDAISNLSWTITQTLDGDGIDDADCFRIHLCTVGKTPRFELTAVVAGRPCEAGSAGERAACCARYPGTGCQGRARWIRPPEKRQSGHLAAPWAGEASSARPVLPGRGTADPRAANDSCRMSRDPRAGPGTLVNNRPKARHWRSKA
jgi:hypothetical protein